MGLLDHENDRSTEELLTHLMEQLNLLQTKVDSQTEFIEKQNEDINILKNEIEILKQNRAPQTCLSSGTLNFVEAHFATGIPYNGIDGTDPAGQPLQKRAESEKNSAMKMLPSGGTLFDVHDLKKSSVGAQMEEEKKGDFNIPKKKKGPETFKPEWSWYDHVDDGEWKRVPAEVNTLLERSFQKKHLSREFTYGNEQYWVELWDSKTIMCPKKNVKYGLQREVKELRKKQMP
ncbi:hypothetical protein ScPMuIL_018527 [Solemya velum]